MVLLSTDIYVLILKSFFEILIVFIKSPHYFPANLWTLIIFGDLFNFYT